MENSASGSSPLARGLLGDILGPLAGERIIPARAGFTRSPCVRGCRRRDHPRSRGVYAHHNRILSRSSGSSPLARGLRRERRRDRARGTDHPRSRGVYWLAFLGVAVPEGSSPLARGLRPRLPLRPFFRGIIPARAGFTSPFSLMAASAMDHPRSRGVYRHTCSGGGVREGSSPLARGLPPTCLAMPRRLDHPRSRGVYGRRRMFSPASPGSSPLARGLRTSPKEPARAHGIIPARAGFTRRRPRRHRG